jgi:hypothetical protein
MFVMHEHSFVVSDDRLLFGALYARNTNVRLCSSKISYAVVRSSVHAREHRFNRIAFGMCSLEIRATLILSTKRTFFYLFPASQPSFAANIGSTPTDKHRRPR